MCKNPLNMSIRRQLVRHFFEETYIRLACGCYDELDDSKKCKLKDYVFKSSKNTK